MELKLKPTAQIITVNGQPARVWEGETDKGVHVQAYIRAVRVSVDDAQEDFQRELTEVKVEPVGKAIDIRLIC